MFHVKQDEYFKILYKLALKSYKNNEIPVSAIIIYKDKIIGKGYNDRQNKHNILGHAEIKAILNASKKIKDWRLNECILISTLKPCDLCNEVIKASRIKEVYYILNQPNTNYSNKKYKLIDNSSFYIEKYKEIFNNFFSKLR